MADVITVLSKVSPRGQGRPRKTADKDIAGMTLNAMKKAFGSEEKAGWRLPN